MRPHCALAFGCILVYKAKAYQRDAAGTNVALAKRIAEDLDVDEEQVAYVIRDITAIGEDYSSLMDAFVPKYLYCTSRSMHLCSMHRPFSVLAY